VAWRAPLVSLALDRGFAISALGPLWSPQVLLAIALGKRHWQC